MQGSKKDAFAPDLPDFPTSGIRPADELIDEATQRLGAIERALEALQRRRRRWSTLAPSAQKELREQIDYVKARHENRGARACRTDRARGAADRVHGLA